MNKKYSVGFYTLGCKVAQYETEALLEAFEARGFEILPFDSLCDFYVVNTCTVTAESDRKCRQIIRRAAKQSPLSNVLVCGCYSQREGDKLLALPGVRAVVGTSGKMRLADIAIDMIKHIERGEKIDTVMGVTSLDGAEFEKMTVTKAPRTRAYVKIEDGCDSKCTYCAIKEARGRIRSKPKDEVIREIEALSKNGTQEIVLTGIEIGAYGKDFPEKYGLADLIAELDARKSCKQIRIGSLAPELVDLDFVEKIKDLKILCPHFHISVQSGSDKILSLMKRRYNANRAIGVINELREKIRNSEFTTDIMVGFPCEDESDFCKTLEFVKKARFLDAHVFCYSRRAGTEAYSFNGQITASVKDERSMRLRTLIKEIQGEILKGYVDAKKTLTALIETRENGFYTAHTPSYIELSVLDSSGCDLRGRLVKVLPVSQKDGILYCETVNN